ncbi:hypothetical protein [Streptomyces sp. GC420]|uniref:hypothetical protein n=1 Tax=Streptomyces sp. GC420 TaxID=2697568 RepID=UPI001414E7C3|nr:hypothetical protein [Streptomyces sp. GC420]NBM16705.1 hypothetical protein [Streptomyces sp. GC420]
MSDTTLQRDQGRRPGIRLRTNFEGIPENGILPPDPNAAAGTTQIVETVNVRFAVYSKTGAALLPPTPLNTLWSGFGGPCETRNDGDPVVRWDTLADRWIITQMSVNQETGEFYECLAVSRGEDATGEWHRYAFQYAEFNDYPKLSVWPDAYYITYNTQNPQTVCALDRARMLTGAQAGQQCFEVETESNLLASDLDGSMPPPRGTPNLVTSPASTNRHLLFWKFHVDWERPARSRLTGPSYVGVAPFTPACAGANPEECVPQGGTDQKLDSISYWLMQRLAYRNFGAHQSLVVNHAVDARGGVGERWYELRLKNGKPAVRQQGTYAPDSTYRWMGSVAQDREGGIALGYSRSSATTYPSIRVTGRLAYDPRGLMTLRETTVRNSAGPQADSNRWGDYTSMAVDPVDDCTFWYTNQYLTAGGDWRTRIASFALPGCTADWRQSK